MKIRNGFVSNSSSSSFVINLDKLNPEQIGLIVKHIEYQSEFSRYSGLTDRRDVSIDNKKNVITGLSSMDNFDMELFMHSIVKVDEKYIDWDHS